MSEIELAWIAAERAEEPLLVGASAYHIGHAFLRAGRNREATALTMDATTALAPSRDAEPERLALWGALHLTALFGAARGSDRRAADQLLNEAERAAERLGDDRNDFWSPSARQTSASTPSPWRSRSAIRTRPSGSVRA